MGRDNATTGGESMPRGEKKQVKTKGYREILSLQDEK